MLSLSHKFVQLRKFAACVLLWALVYQLGACPCGCVEHNAWLQMLGASGHSHAAVALDEDGIVRISGNHDCSGEHVVAYMDNARSVTLDEIARPFSTAALTEVGAVYEERGRRSSVFAASESSQLAHAPQRPALQVYRL
jgi:hypothetical protein